MWLRSAEVGDPGSIPGSGRSTAEGLATTPVFLDFPGGSADKESACNVGDLGLIPGLGRFPWRRERIPTPVFWPREFHGPYSLWGRKELDTTERLSLHFTSIIQSNKVFSLWSIN